MNQQASGRLQVVATPIGNLQDFSERGRAALAEADLIAAEDTRHTLALLQFLGISRPLVSLHAYNEGQRVPELIARLRAGQIISLVSDAGTPLLSDPGYELVSAAAAAGFEVRVFPGPSAITAALAVAGLPTSRFCFEGFLPARSSERRAQLSRLSAESRTLVFFEAPHRIVATLEDLSAVFGSDRLCVAARELTKTHETVYRGTLVQLATQAREDANFQRGELTLVVQGAPVVESVVDADLLRRAVGLLARELPPGRAAAIAAQLSGATRGEAYAMLTQLNHDVPRDGDDAGDAPER